MRDPKLTWAAVLEIRATDERTKDIAERFGVSQSVVYKVRRGEIWTHEPDESGVWRTVPELSKYQVSDSGDLRRAGTLRPVRVAIDVQRRKYVRLRGDDGRLRTVYAHRAVALAFLGPPSADQVVCHNNGDASDNRLANLRWDTQQENARDTIRHGHHQKLNRTACIRGHEYTPETTRIDITASGTRRSCLTCRAQQRSDRRQVNG